MLDFIKRHEANAVLAALITSVLALFSGVGSAWLTYHYNTQSQDRQARLEQVSKFDGANGELIAAAGAFINAINDNKDLEPARRQLSSVLANQIYSVENLQKFFNGNVGKLAREYQQAVSELNQVAQKTNTVTEMRPWTEGFGRVLDTKSALSRELYVALGTKRT